MTLSLPRGAFRSAKCLELEALLLKKAIMFFTAGGQLVWMRPRCPCVTLGEQDWERPCNFMYVGPQSHQKSRQQITFLVGKLLWRFLIGNPLVLIQWHSFGVYCDWSKLFLRSKQWQSFTFCRREAFRGNYVLFLLLTWFTVHFGTTVSQFTWMEVLNGPLLAPLGRTEWISPDEGSIINSNLCEIWSAWQSI